MGLTLREQYEHLCQTPSDIFLHLPRFVALVAELDATNVIELGSRSGVSTVAWLYALEGKGTLTSVDLDAAPEIGTWGHWRHIQGNDQDPDVIAQLEPADIVFLDSSHHYSETVRELNLYRWMVKPGGVLCCHDTELSWPEGAPRAEGPFPVKRAITEFVKDNDFEWFNHTDCWGLGVIRGF